MEREEREGGEGGNGGEGGEGGGGGEGGEGGEGGRRLSDCYSELSTGLQSKTTILGMLTLTKPGVKIVTYYYEY